MILQQISALLRNSAAKHPQSGFGVTHLQCLLLVQHFLTGGVTVCHFVLCQGQNGQNPNHQSHVEQVQGYMETRQKQGDTDVGNTPRPGQEQQQGAEDKSRDRQDESEQRGGEPGGQRQRR